MTTSSQQPSPTCRWPAIQVWITRLFRWAVRVGVVLFIVAIVTIIYLGVIGFPEFLVSDWILQAHDEGYYVAVDKVTLDVLDGLSAQRVVFFETAEKQTPILKADKVSLVFDPVTWLEKGPDPVRIRIEGGDLYVVFPATETAPSQRVTVSNINSFLTLSEKDQWRVEKITASLLGVHIQGEGFVTVDMDTEVELADGSVFDLLQAAIKKSPPWVFTLIDQLKQVDYSDPPAADITFSIDSRNVSGSHFSLTMDGGQTQVREVMLDHWTIAGQLTKGVFTLTSVLAEIGHQKVSLSGTLDVTSDVVSARFFSNVPPCEWFKFLPGSFCRQVDETGLKLDNEFMCEVWVGPAPITNVLSHLSGWISLEKAKVRDIWVEKAFGAFKSAEGGLHFTKLDAVVGRGSQQGDVEGEGTLTWNTMQYAGQAHGTLDPNEIVPILTSNQTEVVTNFVFPNQLPYADVTFQGILLPPYDVLVKGDVSGKNFYYNNVYIDTYTTDATISNNVMTLKDMTLTRSNEWAKGSVVLDFDHDLADLDMHVTLNPILAARIVGPVADDFMSMFTFTGAVDAIAKGIVDYGDYDQTDITGHMEGSHMGMDWAIAEHGVFDIAVKGTKVTITNIQADYCEGNVEGHAVITDIDKDSEVYYTLVVECEDMNFHQLVTASRGELEDPLEGRLSGGGMLSGYIGEGNGPTVTGNGWVKVEEGHLFELRILGPISWLLAQVYPRFGYSIQTDFTADFDIKNSKIYTENGDLEGAVVSIYVRGDYGFDDQMDFKVQVKLLRGGPVASVLRFLTFPVTKLFEFKLQGTLDEPEWSSAVLP